MFIRSVWPEEMVLQDPLFKIYLCDVINPLSDRKATLLRDGALVFKRTSTTSITGSLEATYKILEIGDRKDVVGRYRQKKSILVEDKKGRLALPSFFDVHFHWVQDDVRLAPKDSLMNWLYKYTWPHEARFKQINFSQNKANAFRDQLLRVGTLGGASYGSIHGHTVDHALDSFVGDFAVGNVLMTMNAPKTLCQSPQDGLALVREKDNKYRHKYVITPRFAVTTDPWLMRRAASIAKNRNSFIQTHLCETKKEIKYVLNLFREFAGFEKVKNYTEIYQRCNILGPKTIVGHAIHLLPEEIRILKQTQTRIAHCPTSNAPINQMGLGSGLFDFARIERAGILWALASDIGGGPFLSMFDVIRSFVSQNRKKGNSGATYVKGLYRSTLASAQILSRHKTSGNFSPGKYANFILLNSPRPRKGESSESLLKKVVEQSKDCRQEYQDLVTESCYQGRQVYIKE